MSCLFAIFPTAAESWIGALDHPIRSSPNRSDTALIHTSALHRSALQEISDPHSSLQNRTPAHSPISAARQSAGDAIIVLLCNPHATLYRSALQCRSSIRTLAHRSAPWRTNPHSGAPIRTPTHLSALHLRTPIRTPTYRSALRRTDPHSDAPIRTPAHRSALQRCRRFVFSLSHAACMELACPVRTLHRGHYLGLKRFQIVVR